MSNAEGTSPLRTSSQATALGDAAAHALAIAGVARAMEVLEPTVSARTPFALLDKVGAALGREPLAATAPLLRALAATGQMGSWPVIGSVLGQSLSAGMEEPLVLAGDFITCAGLWYVCDILGERVAGQALVRDQARGMELLAPWRSDACPWVRRAVGVAGHFWAKRCARSAPAAAVSALLDYLSPMRAERNSDAAKGIGWALKTMGRHRPEVVTPWLLSHLASASSYPGPIVLRKATTYLPEELRTAVLEAARREPAAGTRSRESAQVGGSEPGPGQGQRLPRARYT